MKSLNAEPDVLLREILLLRFELSNDPLCGCCHPDESRTLVPHRTLVPRDISSLGHYFLGH